MTYIPNSMEAPQIEEIALRFGRALDDVASELESEGALA